MTFLALLLLFVGLHASMSLNPVLLVPGDGGSVIRARYTRDPPSYICGSAGDWFTLWLNVYYLTPLTLNCFVQTIKLDYNAVDRTTSSPGFCETKVDGFGTSDSMEYFSPFKIKATSYFRYVIDYLVDNLGYVPNKSIRGAPYDFRKAPNEMREFMTDLRKLIEKMYAENGNNPVIIVAHSMGNLYIIRLLNSMSQQWKNKYIRTFVSISAPYRGAVDALRTVLSGNNEHISFLSTIDLRSAQSTWPSTYFLLPVPELWTSNILAVTKNGNYTVDSMPELLKSSGLPFAEDHLEDIRGIQQIALAPNVPVHCIYTDNLPTPELLDYRWGEFPQNNPSIEYGPGDGSVNLQSLQHCTDWKNIQHEKVTTHIIRGVKHLQIMRDSRLMDVLYTIIGDHK